MRVARAEKSCALVVQNRAVLAFRHPCAGCQFVKGGIITGETPRIAAIRELREESGLEGLAHPQPLGRVRPVPDGPAWHLFVFRAHGLPRVWHHQTEDDHGHCFSFFWHPLAQPLGPGWHPIYARVYATLRRRMPGPIPPPLVQPAQPARRRI